MSISISILANFKRRSLVYQTAIVAIIFFSLYSLYMDYISAPNIVGESIFAAVIFSASYFMTSTLVLRKKMQARRKK